MPLADLHMIAMPGNRALDDLTVNTRICAKLIAARPFLQIEQVAEELEGFGLAQQLETEGAAEVTAVFDNVEDSLSLARVQW